MRRRTFDKIVTTVGFGLAVFLFVAAGLLNWGASFAESAVSDQLKAQQIVIPAATDNADESEDVTKFFADNGGAIMESAKQAQMYADHYLGFHLSKMPTYAQASTASRAAEGALSKEPANTKFIDDAKQKAELVNTVFRGTMLKGTLLTAYAFGTLGNIAGIAALVALVGGAFMLLLSVLGLNHIRRTPEDATI
jgi:hypothetical protein